ncbi:hypothetical protein GCM10009744_13370 [Kribbella alba]|uniref:Uncharacterized protein n=1 Tax=Kribbella alba TaxID=190197 RepID=A0ABN2F4E7_9ACTN
MDGVARLAQFIGEGFHPFRESLSVVVQHNLGHDLLAFVIDPDIWNEL